MKILVAPYACTWQDVTLNDGNESGGIAMVDQFHEEPISSYLNPPKTHCGGTGRAAALPGFDFATIDSSMATMAPGPLICSGLPSRSAEHTSRQKLNQ